MKKFLTIVLALLSLTLVFVGCGGSGEENTPEDDGYVELLGDSKFQCGMDINPTGVGNDPDGRLVADLMGTAEGAPYWLYAQHSCSLSTRNGKEKKDGDWYIYTDHQDDSKVSKTLKINPVTGSVSLNCDASKDYKEPRKSSTDPWIHMLLQQGFYHDSSISEMEELILDLSFTLNKMENKTGDAYNPNMHAAQLQLFFVIRSANPMEVNKGLWFGMPLFDNRDTELTQPQGLFDRGTNMYIASIGTATYMEELATVGEQVNIYHDLIPEIKAALQRSQDLGYMQNTTFEDLYLENLNIGWELPGVFDVGVDIHHFSLKAKMPEVTEE